MNLLSVYVYTLSEIKNKSVQTSIVVIWAAEREKIDWIKWKSSISLRAHIDCTAIKIHGTAQSSC